MSVQCAHDNSKVSHHAPEWMEGFEDIAVSRNFDSDSVMSDIDKYLSRLDRFPSKESALPKIGPIASSTPHFIHNNLRPQLASSIGQGLDDQFDNNCSVLDERKSNTFQMLCMGDLLCQLGTLQRQQIPSHSAQAETPSHSCRTQTHCHGSV